MRVQKRGPWLNGLGMVLAAMALWGAQAQAEVSSDKPGSVVMWPKVIADGTRDTLITLTNTRNDMAYAHCEYVQAIGFCSVTGDICSATTPPPVPGSPGACPQVAGNVCEGTWQSADFDVSLTRQQPTFWRASTGRVDGPFVPADGACLGVMNDQQVNGQIQQQCPGIFPNNVPPVVQPFRGELRCIQVTMDGTAVAANGLKGEAVLVTTLTDVTGALIDTTTSTYNSVNAEGLAPPAVDGLIRLNGVEYSACPEAIDLSHYAQGAESIATNLPGATCPVEGCPVESEITVVPCRADFSNENGAAAALQIFYTNEFEQTLSAAFTLDCWANFDLRDLGFAPAEDSGSTFQRTRLGTQGSGRCILGDVNAVCGDDADCGTGGVCGPVSGVIAIVEEFHNTSGSLADPPTAAAGSAASNGFSVDTDDDGTFGRPGRCRGDLTTRCEVDADCGPGLCRYASIACTSDSQCTGSGDFCDRCMNDEISFVTDFQ